MFWDREVNLTITLNGVMKQYNNNLRIDFQIQKGVAGLGESANITIFGLNLNDIDFLAKSISYDMNPAGQVRADSLIQLEAGYKNNKNIIFIGNMTEALPNVDSATYSIQIKAISCYNAKINGSYSNISLKDATLQSVCDTIAKGLGYTLNFLATNKNIGDYSYYGDPISQLLDFRKAYGKELEIYTDNKILYVIDLGKSNNTLIVNISGDSGMIGSPQPMFKGVVVKTLLMPSLVLGGKFSLQSAKLSSLNGIYQIQTLKHKGSNRSDEYISEIEGRLING